MRVRMRAYVCAPTHAHLSPVSLLVCVLFCLHARMCRFLRVLSSAHVWMYAAMHGMRMRARVRVGMRASTMYACEHV